MFDTVDGHLVRIVVGRNGCCRRHRCESWVYTAVAQALAAIPMQGQGITLAEIVRWEQLPLSQVRVALQFMKAWGVITVRRRRCYPAMTNSFEEAMTLLEAFCATEFKRA
ncbi:MAG: hypothetical protein IT440_03735 [Phycisphaeraceae bacterium]|nr:hypothetical protein [Phycisphaeraceae bacterium]